MNRYKILVGTHVQDGQDYKAGDVVVSGINLVETFPNKFQSLGSADEPKFVTNPAPGPRTPREKSLVNPASDPEGSVNPVDAGHTDEPVKLRHGKEISEEADGEEKPRVKADKPSDDEDDADDDVVRKPAPAKTKHAAHKPSKSE